MYKIKLQLYDSFNILERNESMRISQKEVLGSGVIVQWEDLGCHLGVG